MAKLNEALTNQQEATVHDCLGDPDLGLHTIQACMHNYYLQLTQLLESKRLAGKDIKVQVNQCG